MQVRDGDERDLRAILSLRKAVFGEFEADKRRPDFWKWEFLDGPDGKAFIYIAEDNGTVAGHFADVPRRFWLNGALCLGTLSLDLMVHPDYRRRGAFTRMGQYAVQRVAGANGLFMTAFPIRKETIAGFLKLGWEIVGELPVLVYPIRFKGMINRYFHFSPLSLLLAGIARGTYCLLQGGRRKGRESTQGVELEIVNQPDQEFDHFWEKAKGLFTAVGARDQPFLSWRYLKNPVRNYIICRAFESGQMAGYLILRKVDLLGFNSAVIVDLVGLSDRVIRRLIHWGVEKSRQEGNDLLGCMIPKGHAYHQALREAGFLPSGKTFYYMVYRLMKEKVPLDLKEWYVNWGDTDVI